MPDIYNASEIYTIGVEIEKNGRAFYNACAQTTENAQVKKLCEELSGWEGQHVALFEALKASLPEETDQQAVYDPEEEYVLYLKAVADSHIFLINRDVSELVRKATSPRELMEMALAFEKDSVVLYTTMLKMVPDALGKRDIEQIIDEEIRHVCIIRNQLDAMQEG
jgi:rubrerythrin